jgi:hypothetical protein
VPIHCASNNAWVDGPLIALRGARFWLILYLFYWLLIALTVLTWIGVAAGVKQLPRPRVPGSSGGSYHADVHPGVPHATVK